MEFPYEKDNKERIPFEHYLSEYQKLNPKEAAERCGAWRGGVLHRVSGRLLAVL